MVLRWSPFRIVSEGFLWFPKWPPWPLIGQHIIDFFSKTAGPISTKLAVNDPWVNHTWACIRKVGTTSNMAAMASDWSIHYWLLLKNYLSDFDQTCCKWSLDDPHSELYPKGPYGFQYCHNGLWLVNTWLTAFGKLLYQFSPNLL